MFEEQQLEGNWPYLNVRVHFEVDRFVSEEKRDLLKDLFDLHGGSV